MTRRIVRTAGQLAAIALFSLVAVFFLDNKFRVLPTAIHSYLPAHHIGYVVTDLTVKKCGANVFSACVVDGPHWHQINKELYLGSGWITTAHVWVQRKKEEELVDGDKIVLDVRIGNVDPGSLTAKTARKLDDTVSWESRPGGIWIKRTSKQTAIDSENAVTAVDVLFGADAVDPRLEWEIKDTPLLLNSPGEGHEARLSIRRGAHKELPKPVPRINEHGKFKIMQVADLHLSTGTGRCRDAMPDDGRKCDADPRTLEFIGRLLDDEKPDMIVLTGDQVNGDTAADAQTPILKYADLFIKRKIPFATIFGNHDDEKTMSRTAQMEIIESLPYSLSRAGPTELDGVGNYYVEVLARGTSSHSALTLYLLDTHAYSPDEHKHPGYNWLKQSQIDWFTRTAEARKKQHNAYTGIHMNLAFIHIPLPEYRNGGNVFVGKWPEAVTAPTYNSGFADALIAQDVKFVSCGHDHVNEYCMLQKDQSQRPALWMCYGGGAGFGGYAGYGGYHRRVRVFEFDMNESRISTWKRVEFGDLQARVDEQIVVMDGRVMEPEGTWKDGVRVEEPAAGSVK